MIGFGGVEPGVADLPIGVTANAVRVDDSLAGSLIEPLLYSCD
jgi:hypothetical protein